MSSEIRLAHNWLMKADPHCWVLINEYDGKDKDGNPKRGRRETYHANFEQIARYIANREARSAEDLNDIVRKVSGICAQMESCIAEARKLAEAKGETA